MTAPRGAGIIRGMLPASAPPHAVDACIQASDEGQDQRDRGHYARAQAAFGRCSATDCPAMVRRDCAQWLEELLAQMPTIVPSVRDARGSDVLVARVLVDGAEVSRQLDGRPIDVDPGPHVVSFEGPGGEKAEERIVVRTGEKNRIVAVTFAASTAATPVPRSAPAPGASAPGEAARPSRPTPWVPLVLGGASALAFGAGLYVGLDARSQLDGIEAQPCAATRTCNPGDVDAVRTKLVWSDILIGAAAAGAATAVVLYLIGRPGDEASPPSSAWLGVAPLARGGAQATLRATF